jgi:hypothetical protein
MTDLTPNHKMLGDFHEPKENVGPEKRTNPLLGLLAAGHSFRRSAQPAARRAKFLPLLPSIVFATPIPHGRFSKDRSLPLAHSDQSHSALHP